MGDKIQRAGEGESTYLATEKRVTRAEELLCTQYQSAQIVRALCEEFGVVPRTAYAYLKTAYERLQEDDAEERGLRKAKARASWQRQYQRCLDRNDMSAANYALDRLCKLDGLNAPTKHSVVVNATLTVQMEIRAIVGVLDAAGLAALDVLMKQVEAAQAKGLLPSGAKRDPIDAELDDEPRPIPVKGRNRKPRTKS